MVEPVEAMIRRLAGDRCEYCKIPERPANLRHVLDHVIARQHGGTTRFENLALCCGRCNQFKGPNIAGIDVDTGNIARLFNPRADVWADHFSYQGVILVGKTDIGRATVVVLAINGLSRIATRSALRQCGLF
jgi:hypothetical protein